MQEINALTQTQLKKAVTDLIKFNEFTFYGERDTDECTGLTFALEFLYCSLGLNNESSSEDSSAIIEQLVYKLDETAKSMQANGWDQIRPNLPFSLGFSQSQTHL